MAISHDCPIDSKMSIEVSIEMSIEAVNNRVQMKQYARHGSRHNSGPLCKALIGSALDFWLEIASSMHDCHIKPCTKAW